MEDIAIDSDVLKEQQMVMKSQLSHDTALRILELKKTFASQPPKVNLHDLAPPPLIFFSCWI